MKVTCIVGLPIVVALLGSGCREKSQDTLEAQAASHFIRDILSFENDNPGARLTNTLQLFERTTISPWGYPHWLDKQFRVFGKNAGFSNSVYEKYVIMPEGITNRFIGGELVLISAQPFPDRNGKLTRIFIYKKDQNYKYGELPERTVQQILAETGAQIPEPTPMPKPPPAPPPKPPFGDYPDKTPGDRIEMYFRDLAGDIGIGRGSWWILLSACVILLLGLLGSLLWFFPRMGKR